MKKKFNLFFLIFIFSLISFAQANSKQVCDLLLDDYKQNYTEYNLDTIPLADVNKFEPTSIDPAARPKFLIKLRLLL